jgi:hypothetical protein
MAVGRITGQMLSGTLNRVTSDLTIRSTGQANLLQLDTSNNRVGVATASPTVPFEVTGAIKGSTTITANTLALASGSITDSTGAISFGNENLTTTGQINTSGVRLLENEITTIRSNDDLVLSANGTGGVQIEGSLTVSSDLVVNGSTTTVNSTTLTVDDKNIELAHSPSGASPSDTLADGGGVILKGSTDHTILWTNATDDWDFSDSIDLASGKVYKANGTEVLSATTVTTASAVHNVISSADSSSVRINDGLQVDGALDVGSNFTISNGTSINAIVDEDDMSSNSATSLATQQSIKAYVDSQTSAAGVVTIIDDSSSAMNVTIADDDIKIAGGANVTTSISGDTISVALDATLTSLTSVTSAAIVTNTISSSDSTSVVVNDGLQVDGALDVGSNFTISNGTSINAILDEDNLGSDSNTALATQQSIKAYVDAQVTAQDLDFQGDGGGALSIDLDSETLDIAGGTNITTAGSGNTLTVNLDAALSGLTSVQIDSLNLQDNSITTDSNADLELTPGGTGIVKLDVIGSNNSSVINVRDGLDIDGAFSLNTGTTVNTILDEDNLGSDSDSALATQQSIKAYVDSQTSAAGVLTVIDDSSSAVSVTIADDDLKIAGGANVTTSSSGDTISVALDAALTGLTSVQIDSLNLQDNEITTDSNADLILAPGGTGDIDLTAGADVNIPANIGLTFGDDGEKIEGDGTNLTIASSGTMNFDNTGLATFSGALTVTGDLTINGSTTTNSSTNTTIADNIIELNSGISSSSNDIGFIFERGSTGNNAAIIWDESEDKFSFGTTTATAADKSGGITVTKGTLLANIEGTVTGNVTGTLTAGNIQVGVTGDNEIDTTSGNLTLDSAGGTVSVDDNLTVAGDLTANVILSSDSSSVRINDGLQVDGALDVGSNFTISNGTSINAIVDEDDMSSNSATALATQQSIKAYVDAQVTASDLDFQGDSGGALSIDLDSEVLDIAGGTNVNTSGSGNTLTVNLDTALTGLTSVQVDSINIQDNSITTDSNADLEITPGGTGNVVMNKTDNQLILPTGTEAQRNGNTVGSIRYNTDQGSFEGYSSSGWGGLGGGDLTAVDDSSSTISITLAQNSVGFKGGANITSSVSGTDITYALDTALTGLTSVQIDSLNLQDNSITTDSNANLELRPAGTGHIVTDANTEIHLALDGAEKIGSDGTDLTITSGGLINLAATSDVSIGNDIGLLFGNGGEKIESDGTDLTATITGNFVFSGTTAIDVPVGTTAQRPAVSTGLIRFNSTLGVYEGSTDGSTYSTFLTAPSGEAADINKDVFTTTDASTTEFSLSFTPAEAQNIIVYVDNIIQEPTENYTVSGSTLTMTAALHDGARLVAIHGFDGSGGVSGATWIGGSNTDIDSAIENVDTFTTSTFRSAEYTYVATNAEGDGDSTTGHETGKILVVHDGSTAYLTQFGITHTPPAPLMTFSVDIDSGSVRLRAASIAANTGIRFARLGLAPL